MTDQMERHLASKIDHTILVPEATRVQVHQTVVEATQHGFAAVCVHGMYVAEVAKALAGSGVKTCAVVGFPMGAVKSSVKAIEAVAAVKDGAQEIDFVAHLPALWRADWAAAKTEFIEVVKAARSADRAVTVKVIIESALLLGDGLEPGRNRIEAACRAARESGCDYVKTSTGFHPAGGATVEAVQLMREYSEGLSVKASGGIRTRTDALRMIDAGADRLGCSRSIAIVTGTP